MQETILKNGRQYRSHPVHISHSLRIICSEFRFLQLIKVLGWFMIQIQILDLNPDPNPVTITVDPNLSRIRNEQFRIRSLVDIFLRLQFNRVRYILNSYIQDLKRLPTIYGATPNQGSWLSIFLFCFSSAGSTGSLMSRPRCSYVTVQCCPASLLRLCQFVRFSYLNKRRL